MASLDIYLYVAGTRVGVIPRALYSVGTVGGGIWSVSRSPWTEWRVTLECMSKETFLSS